MRGRRDPQEFAEIVREHQAMVFSLALRFLRDHETAEELAQDVFLQLHQKLDELESPSHIKFWLRKAIGHRCVDEARRRRLRPRICLEQVPEPAARTATLDPMLRDSLQRLVATLPEHARLAVIMRYQEDMDPGEIAAALDLPVGTVKSQLHRSLAILRGKLERGRLTRRPPMQNHEVHT